MTTKKPANSRETVSDSPRPARTTFLDHIQELKGRLFWIVIYFLAFSGVAYAYFPQVTKFLMAPLGGHDQLYYLTPSGGLSFIIKVCMYVGIIAALPVVIYHIYRFISPVMKRTNFRLVVGYTIASMILAAAGIAFAYVVSLPAALQFLVGITVENITAMLTIDAYLSFVIAYLLAGATLFQLPLLLLIIDGVSPLPPKKLMGFQRHMIIGSFVFAAIVSPTPDVINQTILAMPVVVMYQVGIILISWRHATKRRRLRRAEKHVVDTTPSAVAVHRPKLVGNVALRSSLLAPSNATAAPVRAFPARSIDGVVRNARSSGEDRGRLTVPQRQHANMGRSIRPARSIDGIL